MATSAASAVPSVTPEILIERARAMLPALKARSDAATAARCIPAETIREMQDAGFFRVLQPARHGGYEMHPQVFYEIQMALGEGCMSTAWIYGVIGVHPFQLALFDARAQSDVGASRTRPWSHRRTSPSARSSASMAVIDSRAAGASRAVAITASGCCSAR